jgi:hypothetical protein
MNWPATAVSVRAIYRVRWVPGMDGLLGTCHCGAAQTADDPIVIWQWLLSHPEGHHPGR